MPTSTIFICYVEQMHWRNQSGVTCPILSIIQ